MKKVLFMIMAVVFCQSASAQSFWKTDDCDNFNLIQAGYMSESGFNGVFAGYKYGLNITGKKLPLYLEPGAEFHYVSYPNGNGIGLTVPVNVSYKFKTGDFSISPITGPTFGYSRAWNSEVSGDDFVFGWEFGGRIAYKRITLSYRYNKVITNSLLHDVVVWNYHKLAIGFTF
ncbi:MAG: hypothetical protein J5630_02500 [Bacteroidaceae bacterium]|nr:hypothetical protein [Bacteroidaceae bacterium]